MSHAGRQGVSERQGDAPYPKPWAAAAAMLR